MNLSAEAPEIENRAEALRAEFDRSFAASHERDETQRDDLLAIRLGGDPYAFRLADVVELVGHKHISHVPSTVRGFIGVSGFRGAILPVYDLRMLLGYSANTPPQWLVVAAKLPVALAFDALDGHLRIERTQIASEPESAREFVSEIARIPDAPRPIIRMQPILDGIAARSREAQRKRSVR